MRLVLVLYIELRLLLELRCIGLSCIRRKSLFGIFVILLVVVGSIYVRELSLGYRCYWRIKMAIKYPVLVRGTVFKQKEHNLLSRNNKCY